MVYLQMNNLFDDWFDPIQVDDYGKEPFSDGWVQQPEIAILYASGVIVSGASQDPGLFGGMSMVGSQTLIERRNPKTNIKAGILRETLLEVLHLHQKRSGELQLLKKTAHY